LSTALSLHDALPIFLILYILYLVFQLKTHSHLYEDPHNDGEREEEYPCITMHFACGLLIIVTLFVSACAEYLVCSIEGMSDRWRSEEHTSELQSREK